MAYQQYLVLLAISLRGMKASADMKRSFLYLGGYELCEKRCGAYQVKVTTLSRRAHCPFLSWNGAYALAFVPTYGESEWRV